jgi:hypothetical protein
MLTARPHDRAGVPSLWRSHLTRKVPKRRSAIWRAKCLSPHVSLSLMSSTATFRESRRSTRVPLKVVITIEGGTERRTCDGETIIVNLHGALIATAIGLSTGMRISVHVYLTDKRAAAQVVYIDPKSSLLCGIELDEPQNIWGVPLPPDDWTAL